MIVTDLKLPGMSGHDLVKAVRLDNPTTPILIMSVINSVEQAVALINSGADDYLIKPLDFSAFKDRVERALRSIATTRDLHLVETSLQRALEPGNGVIWGTSPAMLRAVAQIPMLARTDAPVLVHGESGVGKEIVARAIHYSSRRAGGPMVAISCAAIPEGLWEREFFGHVKGAYSDSGSGGPGVVEAAEGGTLFLDEIGEVPFGMQAKLLRFLQEKEYRRVGDTELRKSDVRIVSATNRDLQLECAAGRFREDLYYRIGVLPLALPPLRERKEDITQYAMHFLRRYAEEYDKPVIGFSPRALQKLCSHDFPGNIRELENITQQCLARARYSIIGADDIPVGNPSFTEERPGQAEASPPATAGEPFTESVYASPYSEAKAAVTANFEIRYVSRLLKEHDGNITRAAEAAGLTRKSLSRIIKRNELGAESGYQPRLGRPLGS